MFKSDGTEAKFIPNLFMEQLNHPDIGKRNTYQTLIKLIELLEVEHFVLSNLESSIRVTSSLTPNNEIQKVNWVFYDESGNDSFLIDLKKKRMTFKVDVSYVSLTFVVPLEFSLSQLYTISKPE